LFPKISIRLSCCRFKIGSETCVTADSEVGSENCIAADSKIGSKNRVVVDSKINQKKLHRCRFLENYVAADSKIGSKNYVVADSKKSTIKLHRCRSRNQQRKLHRYRSKNQQQRWGCLDFHFFFWCLQRVVNLRRRSDSCLEGRRKGEEKKEYYQTFPKPT
jgi:hypothetical protein